MPKRPSHTDAISAGRSTIQFYCSPHATANLDPEPALIKLIASAKQSLLVGIYSLTLPAVAQAIIAKFQSGVPVRMLVDATEMTAASSQVPLLIAAGIDLRCWGSDYRLMHAKVLVADNQQCVLGSYNFSGLAEQDDVEVMITVSDAKLAAYLTLLIGNAYAAGVLPPG